VSTALPPPQRTSWWSKRETRDVFAIWAVLTVLLVVFSLTVPDALMGAQASNTMKAVERTFGRRVSRGGARLVDRALQPASLAAEGRLVP
jgi:hypothetical protein